MYYYQYYVITQGSPDLKTSGDVGLAKAPTNFSGAAWGPEPQRNGRFLSLVCIYKLFWQILLHPETAKIAMLILFAQYCFLHLTSVADEISHCTGLNCCRMEINLWVIFWFGIKSLVLCGLVSWTSKWRHVVLDQQIIQLQSCYIEKRCEMVS